MQPIFANQSVSISELKRNPSAVIEQANGQPVVILNHNTPSAYLVPNEMYEKMMDLLDDFYLSKIAHERLANFDVSKARTVSLDELMSDDF